MPKNRIHKASDGRWSYKTTDAAGKEHQLKSRKDETHRAFGKRCNALDDLCRFELRADTFHELFSLWRAMHLDINLSNADANLTVRYYESFVEPRIGHLKLNQITAPVIYQLLTEAVQQGWSRSTVSKIKGIVSRPFNWAVQALNLQLLSPTSSVRFKMKSMKKPKRRRFLSHQEADRFFHAAIGSKYRDCFRLMILLGLRPSEALGLQARDVQQTVVTIRRGITLHDNSDGKTDEAPRDIRLPSEAVEILTRLKRDMAFATPEGWLFPTETGTPSMSALKLALRRILHKANKTNTMQPVLHISSYDFRHTFATWMVELGMPPVTLKTIMGHADIKTTLTYYSHVTDAMRDDGVNLMNIASGTKSGTELENEDETEIQKSAQDLQPQAL